MTGKRIGYVRVSTYDQNPERQLEGVILDKKFTDFASGKTTIRPQLEQMLAYLREDDTLIVHSMDRLARNVRDLRKIIDDLVARKIKVEFRKENLIFNGDDSPMSMFMLMLMGSVAEFEHANILERQREGIAIAKKAGKYRGRKRLASDKIIQLNERLKSRDRDTKAKIARELGISRQTLYKYLEKPHEEKAATTREDD